MNGELFKYLQEDLKSFNIEVSRNCGVHFLNDEDSDEWLEICVDEKGFNIAPILEEIEAARNVNLDEYEAPTERELNFYSQIESSLRKFTIGEIIK
jgi:hypothetical protein